MKVASRIFHILAAIIILAILGSCQKNNPGTTVQPASAKNFVFQSLPAKRITFLSTQMNPVEEAGKMREVILKDFPGTVDFRPNDNSYMFRQIDVILEANPAESIVLGANHGDMVSLYEKGSLQEMDAIYADLKEKNFSPALVKLSRLDGEHVYYIPWNQASFVMIANRKALAYLPKGIDLDTLTYEQLEQWARAIFEKTGMKALGFPAGKNGLMHRFFQGYLYPSFTGSTLLQFRSQEAKKMWSYFKRLWSSVQPGSLTYSNMSEPLLTGEVWIAWDHTARLIEAIKEKPDDFVVFPSPVGPRGRGYMAIISGLALPKKESEVKDSVMLIDYLTEPEIQGRTMRETGFFPVVALRQGSDIPPYLKTLKSGVDKQTDSSEAVMTLAPIGLGEQGADYNSLFMLTFSEIVLDGKDIETSLKGSAEALQRIIDKANAKCWPPDVSQERPCKIE